MNQLSNYMLVRRPVAVESPNKHSITPVLKINNTTHPAVVVVVVVVAGTMNDKQ